MLPARASITAQRVALRRAAHQLLDHPVVFDDPLALPVLGPEAAAALRADPERFEAGPLAPYLRAFFAVRSRFAEDRLASARSAGITQYVVLGAGLDTFAYRTQPAGPPLRIWEVDHPATQAWKQERLRQASIACPPALTFVPADLERDTLSVVLEASGFDPTAGAVVSWLGVTPYLARPAIESTLVYLAEATKAGGGVAFDYALAPQLLTTRQRLVFDHLAARVGAAGEPWQTFFDPGQLTQHLRRLGFAVAEDLPPEALNSRYLADRSDGLRVGSLAHLMWAGAA